MFIMAPVVMLYVDTLTSSAEGGCRSPRSRVQQYTSGGGEASSSVSALEHGLIWRSKHQKHEIETRGQQNWVDGSYCSVRTLNKAQGLGAVSLNSEPRSRRDCRKTGMYGVFSCFIEEAFIDIPGLPKTGTTNTRPTERISDILHHHSCLSWSC